MKNKKIFFNPMSAIVIVFIIAAIIQTLEKLLIKESEIILILIFDLFITMFGFLSTIELNKCHKSKKLGEHISGISRNRSRKNALAYIMAVMFFFAIKTAIIAFDNIQKTL